MKRLVLCVAIAVAALAMVAPHELDAPRPDRQAASVAAAVAVDDCRCMPTVWERAGTADPAKLVPSARLKAPVRAFRPVVVAALVALAILLGPRLVRRWAPFRSRADASAAGRGPAWTRGPPIPVAS